MNVAFYECDVRGHRMERLGAADVTARNWA